MKIVSIKRTPLLCRLKQDYHWAQGLTLWSQVILIEIQTDEGIVGIAESGAGPSFVPMLSILDDAIPYLIGKSVFDGNKLIWDYHREAFRARGIGVHNFYTRIMSGIELALWDAIGKAMRQPLHRILGGAVRDRISYFGFVQGDTPQELAQHAKELKGAGYKVLYVKVGRGDTLDLQIVAAVRDAIGDVRLRLDANDAWDSLTANRMLERLKPFDIEMVEQPVPGLRGAEALARIRAAGVPLAADSSCNTPEDVYEMCQTRAVDVVVVGLHETCGVVRYRKAAAIAEAANVRICIHGIFETGITTCAGLQVGATISNLDDGNQIMCQLLAEDLVASPNLVPADGALPVPQTPGLGFELNADAVARAAEAYRKQMERGGFALGAF